MQTPADLAKQVKAHFDNGDFEAGMKVINEVLKRSGSHLDAGAQLRQAQQNVEDEKLREEFEIHVANLKHEAMKQFDQELYSECFGTFRFLCELEPDNRTVRDYLELCQQLVLGTEDNVSGGDAVAAPDDQRMSRSSSELPIALELSVEPASLDMSVLAGDPNLQTQDYERHEHHGSERDKSPDVTQRSVRQGSQPAAELARAETLQQNPKSVAESVTIRLRFGLVAIAVLVITILGIAYLKGPGRTWHSSGETRSSAGNTAGGASEPGRTAAQLDPQTFWLQKAESAVSLGHYVSPPNDNAVAYCNRVLVLAPENSKARRLKDESVNQAIAQAQRSIESGRFTEAQQIYSALLQLSQQERRFQLTPQELNDELKKLEFTVYPVVHDHLFGSCKGLLKVNSYGLSFVPSGDSRDSFTEPFAEVTLFRPRDKLKIEIRAKTYRFESNLGSKHEKEERIKSIFRDLKERMAKES
jgi:tetratricopeptide (TPR) repeat protein